MGQEHSVRGSARSTWVKHALRYLETDPPSNV